MAAQCVFQLLKIFMSYILIILIPFLVLMQPILRNTTQSRIFGAVRGGHSQLWGTIIPVCSSYAARKYDRRLGTPAIV